MLDQIVRRLLSGPTPRLALTASLLLAVPTSAWAQSFTGRIVGTVTDSTGGIVVGAMVKATEVATNRTQSATSNEAGNYALSEVPRGEYMIDVTAPGFKQFVRRGILLSIGQQARVDVRLEVGAVSESVEVVADAGLLETVDSVLGKVVDNKRITELPLNTRNVFSLLYLTPGVTGSVSTTYGTGYAINGARNSMLDILVDGVSTAHPTVNGFSGNSTYSAEFGRSNGGVVNVVYKSGTNELHGSLFEFLRNSKLDANDFFNNSQGRPLGSFKRNQFGAMVNGPIVKNRTFFLGSFEGLRERSSANTSTSVPTALQRAGDFSQTRASNGSLITIYDPFTTRAQGSGFVRTAFPGNVIPAAQMDAVARNVMRYYPQPNTVTNSVTNLNNFFNTGARSFDQDQIDGRVDHNITDQQRIFARISWRENLDSPPIYFPQDLTIAEGRVQQGVRQPSGSIDYTNTVTPTSVLNVRFGLSRSVFDYDNQGLGFKPSALGLPSAIDSVVDRQMFPRFGASGFVNLGGNDHRFSSFNTYTLSSSFSRIQGNHTLKFGWEGRMIRVNVWEARSAGTFNFSAGFTQGPNPNTASSTAGHSVASLLLGTGTTGNVLIRNWKNVASQSFYHGFYFQDDYRITSKLTLNVGLRYDVDLPRTERLTPSHRSQARSPASAKFTEASASSASTATRARSSTRTSTTSPPASASPTRPIAKRSCAPPTAISSAPPARPPKAPLGPSASASNTPGSPPSMASRPSTGSAIPTPKVSAMCLAPVMACSPRPAPTSRPSSRIRPRHGT
jgi:hypothetical protein